MAPPRRRTRRRRGPLRGGGTGGGRGGFLSTTAGGTRRSKGKVASGGQETAREAARRVSGSKKTSDKIKGLEQSIGSLDRRINNALEKGNTNLAKDLRSRLNKFTTQLGDARAVKAGGVMRTSDGSIIRTSDGRPVFNNKGLGVFNETKDKDFLDPTRKLINEYPDQYSKMYPVANQLRQGLPGSRFLKGIAGVDDKAQKFTDSKMPGERYALDKKFGAADGIAGVMDDEMIADEFDKALDVAPPGVPLGEEVIVPADADPTTPGIQKPQPDASDLSLLESLFDANINEPGIQVFNPSPEPGDRVPPFAPDLFKNIGAKILDADPNTPGIQVFNTNPSGNRNVNMQVKEPGGSMMQVDENPIIPGTQVSGENFVTQVAENNQQLKENVINNPNLNVNQKQAVINQIDSLTQFQPMIDQTSILDADPGQSMFPVATTNALTSANPASEAAALEILNSLDNQNQGFNLFDFLGDTFDANPDRQGFQLFNLNPNR